MSIKAGQLIHVGNQILVDRAQTGGPGTVNINRTKIYELGNYLSVGSVADIPDLSFSLESFDASAEFEAMLVGKSYAGDNLTQVVTLTGAPAGGTFTLSFGGQTTSGIAFDASASTVDTALEALTSIPASEVAVSGSAGGPWTVTFSGSLAGVGQLSLMTGSGASLTGGTTPAVAVTGDVMADGTALLLSDSLPMDVASEFKAGKTNATPFNTVGGVAIPYLTLESASYKFGISDNASQTFTLKGDGLFYTPGSVYIEETVGTDTASQSVLLSHLAYAYNGDTVAGVRYAISVSLSTGERLSFGTDYTETVSGTGDTRTVHVVVTDAVPTTTKIRITYASDTVRAFPQAVHALASTTRPAAIRGRNITVAVNGVTLGDRWNSVQSIQFDYKTTLQRDEEFGNSSIVAQDYDVPDVSGNIGVKPRSYAELYDKVQTIAGISGNEVIGALTTEPMPLYIELHSPDQAGLVLKSFYVPDARFNLPGFSGRVQQKLEVQFDWTSETGACTIYKGAKP